MKYIIEIDDEVPNGRIVLQLLRELHIDVKPKEPLTAKDVAFGIGRMATEEELVDYIKQVEKSPTININEAIKRFEK